MEYTKDIETEDFIDKVANDCIANMTEDIKKEFIGDPDPNDFHFSYGIYIRNHYIHNKELPFFLKNPDDLSNEIIVRIIEIVNGSGKEK